MHLSTGLMVLVVYASIGISAATWAAVQGALARHLGVVTEKWMLGANPYTIPDIIMETAAALLLWPFASLFLLAEAVSYARQHRERYNEAGEPLPPAPPRVQAPPTRGQRPVVPAPAPMAASPKRYRLEPTVVGRAKDDRLLVDASTPQESRRFYLMKEPDRDGFTQAFAAMAQRELAKLGKEAKHLHHRYPF